MNLYSCTLWDEKGQSVFWRENNQVHAIYERKHDPRSFYGEVLFARLSSYNIRNSIIKVVLIPINGFTLITWISGSYWYYRHKNVAFRRNAVALALSDDDGGHIMMTVDSSESEDYRMVVGPAIPPTLSPLLDVCSELLVVAGFGTHEYQFSKANADQWVIRRKGHDWGLLFHDIVLLRVSSVGFVDRVLALHGPN